MCNTDVHSGQELGRELDLPAAWQQHPRCMLLMFVLVVLVLLLVWALVLAAVRRLMLVPVLMLLVVCVVVLVVVLCSFGGCPNTVDRSRRLTRLQL